MKNSRTLILSIGLALAMTAGCGGADSTVQPVPDEINQVFAKPLYRNATWSLRVVDRDTGEPIYDMNSDKPMLVGSVRKLFSVGLALETLGPAHVFRTTVPRQGAVAGGVLAGNLILVASGDLAMGGRTNADGTFAISRFDHNEANSLGNAELTATNPLAGFDALAAQVAASGITRVAGEVVIDDRLFEPFSFQGEYDVRPIFVNDNVVDAIITNPGGVPTVDWLPKSAAFSVTGNVTPGQAGSALDLTLDPISPTCIGTSPCVGTVSGVLPADLVPTLTGQYPLIRAFRITQPSNYARTVFIEALVRAGVAVDAVPVASNPVQTLPARGSYVDSTLVAELISHPYKDYAKHVLKVSYNLGADVSLMLFGLAKGTRSFDVAKATELTTLANEFGISAAHINFPDGGGGGQTRATAVAVTKFLLGMTQRSTFSHFIDSQPSLGVDGSLSFVTNFEADPTLAGAKGQVQAKTGTYVTVDENGPNLAAQALAGYITSKSGRRLAYSLAVNNVGTVPGGIDDVIKAFQDEGTISAIIWKSL